ncbi:glycine--tRNA ligase subunit beta [soil metagenome]
MGADNNKQNLLVELFVEELPPKVLKKLGDAFAGVLLTALRERGLATDASTLTSYASPRRLAAHITSVYGQAPARELIEKLMPVSVALKDSTPTEALRKRLAKVGRAHLADLWPDASDGSDRLFVQADGKVEAVYLRSMAVGSSLQVGLEFALADAIAKLPIPKVMSYQLEGGSAMPGWTSVSFVRPAHGLVALHGADVVAVEALGLKSGRDTHGHRFEASVDPVVLRDADSYAQQLADEGAVIAGFDTRRADIARQLAAAAVKVGSDATPIDDDALLDEVTALVERPNVVVCSFEPEFLEVPQECLILTMKANQKYFPLLDGAGKLTNKFLVVSNISPDDTSAVVQGNERVIRPRLADAKFFFDQDRKKSLASRVELLGKVVYHNKLGTQGERVARVMQIAEGIAKLLVASAGDATLPARAVQAAQLAKADLVTDMVGEFPELQGTMGRYYALHDGLDVSVADAIEDHYKPRFAGDTLPRGDVGVVVALADKLETLVGMFGIGNLPTGDRDPFALRRHALGVVRILIERDLPLHFDELVRIAFDSFKPGLLQDAKIDVGVFLFERLKSYLRDAGSSATEVDAAIYAEGMKVWADLPARLAAVRSFAALPEAPALAAANKRLGNILTKAPDADAHVSELLLQEPAEKALYAAMANVVPAANAQFDAGDYTASLQTLAALREPVDAFFDGVMVNAEQADLRLNRLGLLKSLHEAMNRVAQLERLAA